MLRKNIWLNFVNRKKKRNFFLLNRKLIKKLIITINKTAQNGFEMELSVLPYRLNQTFAYNVLYVLISLYTRIVITK